MQHEEKIILNTNVALYWKHINLIESQKIYKEKYNVIDSLLQMKT